MNSRKTNPAPNDSSVPQGGNSPSPAWSGERESLGQTLKTETSAARFWVSESLLELEVRGKLLAKVKTSDALRVHIKAEGQNVVLTGELEKESNIALVESVARTVKGVQQVTNQLTFAPDQTGNGRIENAVAKGGSEIKDALLETKIKTKLIAKSGVGAFKIEVEAVDGVVRLSGSVPDESHREDAVRIARETSSVQEVRDLLKIKSNDSAN